MMFEIMHGEVAITPENINLIASDVRTRATHKHKFHKQQKRTEHLRHSFVNSTLQTWNTLPATVTERLTLLLVFYQLAVMLD